jgi:hypothetical protein
MEGSSFKLFAFFFLLRDNYALPFGSLPWRICRGKNLRFAIQFRLPLKPPFCLSVVFAVTSFELLTPALYGKLAFLFYTINFIILCRNYNY